MPIRWNLPLEYKPFIELKRWQPVHQIMSPDKLLSSQDSSYPLFSALYFKTKELYRKVPTRKNGEDSFIHPLNAVRNLRKAGVTDGITLCAGLVHDFIEEDV